MKPLSRSSLLLVLGMTALYMLTFGGHYVMGDNFHRIAWAKALLDHGSHDISAYVPGERYSTYGVGHTLLHIPFLLLARGITALTGVRCEGPVNMLPYVLNGVLGILLLQRIQMRYGVAPGAAAVRAAVAGVATVWFPYTKLEYSESLVATGILAMWQFAPTSPWLAGLIGGLTVSVRTESALWATFTGAMAPGDRGGKLRMALGMVPGVALTAWANWVRTGHFHTSGYDTAQFNNPVWIGVYGILFSAGKSVFLFSPLLLLAPAALRSAWAEGRTRRFALWASGLFLGQLLFYAAWFDWSGDDAWGERFVIPSVLALLAVVLTYARLSSPWFWLLAALGLAVELPAVALGPHTSEMMQHLQKPTRINILKEGSSPITLDELRYNPRYSQVTATWELLVFKLTGHVPHSADPWLTGSTWSEGFPHLEPPPWDFFWLHLRRRGAGDGGGQARARDAPRGEPDRSVGSPCSSG
jgi:hypothetical protein